MKALLVKPNTAPELIDIENTLTAYYKTLNCDTIEAVYPFEDTVAIVCDETGKIVGKEKNRYLCDEGDPYDCIVGDFLVVGLSDDDFTDLTEKQARRFFALFCMDYVDTDLTEEELDNLVKFFEEE